jgi:hypothetical protein
MNHKDLEEYIQRAAMQLQNVDHDIKAIVLFGSCVYAPDLAQDIDLFIITAQKKISTVYWDVLSDMPMWVDVVVKEVGEPLGDGLKLGVKVFGRLLWGEERYVEEVLREMPVPAYDDARIRLRNADRYMNDSLQTSDERERHGYYRDAFNCLFDAARLAAMAFLKTEQTRWGELRRILPSPFDERFRQIVNRLHVDYFYESSYPADRVKEEYQLWCEEVKRFTP